MEHQPEIKSPIVITDNALAEMVNRFLSWKLPIDFNPDGGVIFSHSSGGVANKPTGTNLLNAAQAKQMIQHILGLAS